jgi:hypothetical protein
MTKKINQQKKLTMKKKKKINQSPTKLAFQICDLVVILRQPCRKQIE